MKLQFSKMHGLGNDFVLLDGRGSPVHLSADQVRYIADRRRGIGCDQVLVIDPATLKGADVAYRVFNADGAEVEQCGNGVRCVACYVRDRGLAVGASVIAETMNRAVEVFFEPDGLVRVNMGEPEFEPTSIPFQAEKRDDSYDLMVDDREVRIGAVSMGNPHAVIEVDSVEAVAVAELGAAVQSSHHFPAGVNVGFVQFVDQAHVRLRVYERGAGETPACGTGACAAVVVGRCWSRLDPAVDVELPGGNLRIEWQGEGADVWMTGPIKYVFEGTIEI